MIEKEIILSIKNGLHARPSADLVKKLATVSSDVQFYVESKQHNPKSIISLMSASIKEGQTIKVVVSGDDEEETMSWLTSFL